MNMRKIPQKTFVMLMIAEQLTSEEKISVWNWKAQYTSQIPMRERLRLRFSKVVFFVTSEVFVKLLFKTRLTPVSFAYSRVVSSELLREHLRCELWRRQVLPSCWHLPSPSLPSSTLASKLSPLTKVPIVHLASPLAPTHTSMGAPYCSQS